MYHNLFFIISSPRAGSTWLANLINSHPETIYRHEPLGRIYQHIPSESFKRLKTNYGLADEERDGIFSIISRGYPDCDRPPFFRKNYSLIPPQVRYFFWMLASHWKMLAPFYTSLMASPLSEHTFLVIKETGWSFQLESILAGFRPKRNVILLRHPCAIIASMLDGIDRNLMKIPNEALRHQWYENHRHEHYLKNNKIELQSVLDADIAIFFAMRIRVLYDIFMDILRTQKEKTVVVVYENLQNEPVEETRKLFRALGLEFCRQTEDFILKSTGRVKPGLLQSILKDSKSSFYSVQRHSAFKPDKWRSKLNSETILRIKETVGKEIMQKFWPTV